MQSLPLCDTMNLLAAPPPIMAGVATAAKGTFLRPFWWGSNVPFFFCAPGFGSGRFLFARLCILPNLSTCSGRDRRRCAPVQTPGNRFECLAFRRSAQSGILRASEFASIARGYPRALSCYKTRKMHARIVSINCYRPSCRHWHKAPLRPLQRGAFFVLLFASFLLAFFAVCPGFSRASSRL